MAKKNKTIQLQSPENYIRSRARSLRIAECLISPDWKDSGIANIVVTRQHTNGNITAGVYLVDLYCLGVKNSMYMFNVSESYLREKIESFEGMKDFEKISYTLAHNIIYAAIEFAGDYGFAPDKTFESITKYILEEDTDAIELIDIECGFHGKPSFFQGPNDSPSKVNMIIKKLESTAGKGNYHFTLAADDTDDFDFSDEDYNENSEDDEAENNMTFNEAEAVLRKHVHDFTKLDKQNMGLFLQAVNVIFDSMIDEDDYDELYNNFVDDLDIGIDEEYIPDEMLIQTEMDPSRLTRLKKGVAELFEQPEQKMKKVGKLMSSLKSGYPGVPFVLYLELYFDSNRETDQYKLKLNTYLSQYPDYPLFRIMALIESFVVGQERDNYPGIVSLSDIFNDRESLHVFEMQQYLMYVFLKIISESNKSGLSAFNDALIELEFPDEIMDFIYPPIFAEKIKACLEKLNIQK